MLESSTSHLQSTVQQYNKKTSARVLEISFLISPYLCVEESTRIQKLNSVVARPMMMETRIQQDQRWRRDYMYISIDMVLSFASYQTSNSYQQIFSTLSTSFHQSRIFWAIFKRCNSTAPLLLQVVLTFTDNAVVQGWGGGYEDNSLCAREA